jgi:hypothetical protein
VIATKPGKPVNEGELRMRSLDVSQLLAEAERREAAMVARLRTLVEIESPSSNKAAVDRVLSTLGAWAEQAGGSLRRHRHRANGDSLEIRSGKCRDPLNYENAATFGS